MQIDLHTRRGSFWIGVECGQRLWLPRSWQRHKSCDNLLRHRKLQGVGGGHAFGPIMFGRK